MKFNNYIVIILSDAKNLYYIKLYDINIKNRIKSTFRRLQVIKCIVIKLLFYIFIRNL